MSKDLRDNPYVKIRHQVHHPTKEFSSKKDYKRDKVREKKFIEEELSMEEELKLLNPCTVCSDPECSMELHEGSDI